jgi:XTP/dITP diphosphohydrolase
VPDHAPDPVAEFAAVVRLLRARCPWKAAQTHASLVRHLLEEAHEAVEAIETGTPADLREELGDLLLQVFLHTAIAEQAGAFTLDDVAREVTAKMVRRNPHVLGPQAGGAGSMTPTEVNEAWEAAKAREKSRRTSVADGIAPTLPALMTADKVLDRLHRAGVDPVLESAADEDADLGERLLALVAEARATGTDPEQALRAAVRRRLPAP